MKIWKYKLKTLQSQILKMPEKSNIIDIQMQNGDITMWAMVDPETKEKEVKINMHASGDEIHENNSNDEYLATIQDGGHVWHFFMNYEIDL